MKKIFIKSCIIGLLSFFISKAEAQSNLVSFGPSLSYIWVGDLNAQTITTPLTVTLDFPTSINLFISISSSDPASLDVVGGGVAILSGNSSATVLLNGIMQNPSVQLTASLSSQQLSANVRVVATNELPQLVSINPSINIIQPGDILTLTAQLDIPSFGGTTINLSLNPSNAGAIPASITIPANQISSQFNYTDANVLSYCTITGQLGASQSSAEININPLNILNSTIELSYSVFPNPFSNQITFAISDNEQSTISLYTMYSQIILKEVFSKSININTEQLENGVYIYELQNSNGVFSKGKIVKN